MLIKIGTCWVDPSEIAAVQESDPNRELMITLRGTEIIYVKATMDEAEAALIDAGAIEDPYPEEAFETPALSDEERTELEALDAQGYEYIARDADGELYAYKCEPGRADGYYFARNLAEAVKVEGSFGCVDFGEAWSINFLLCK